MSQVSSGRTVSSLIRRAAFDSINSFLLSETEFLQLEQEADLILASAPPVDSLRGYNSEMWGILTDDTEEWLGFVVPHPWTKKLYVPRLNLPGDQILLCLDQHSARELHRDVHESYLTRQLNPSRVSVFANYGLKVENDFEREREGMEFLARQVDHFTTEGQRLIVLLSRSSELWNYGSV